MAKECTPRMTMDCRVQTLKDGSSVPCPDWEFCLPFHGRVYSLAGCIHYEAGTPPEDGIYGKVIIENGCITGLEKADAPLYAASPCAPVPVPCDCDGSGSGSLPSPSPTAGNLFAYDAAGLPLVKVSIQAGDNISVSGSGTATDPLIISGTAAVSTAVNVQSANNAITVDGDGSRETPYKIGHKSGYQGTVLGMQFDSYGHLTSYNAPTQASTVNGVVGGEGVSVSTDVASGIATVSIEKPLYQSSGKYIFGGYNVNVDEYNRIESIERAISIANGRYVLGNYALTINAYGSVEEIEPIQNAGVVSTSVSKLFTQTSADLFRQMSFTTASDSAFRISYKGTSVPSDIQVYVDDIVYQGYMVGANQYEVLTPATFGAGDHTVRVQTDQETGFTGVGFLDVMLTVVV